MEITQFPRFLPDQGGGYAFRFGTLNGDHPGSWTSVLDDGLGTMGSLGYPFEVGIDSPSVYDQGELRLTEAIDRQVVDSASSFVAHDGVLHCPDPDPGNVDGEQVLQEVYASMSGDTQLTHVADVENANPGTNGGRAVTTRFAADPGTTVHGALTTRAEDEASRKRS